MSLNTILATTPLTSTGYHLKATGTTIGNSLIWDNGTNVGIGNTNTSYTLDVSGTGRFTSNLAINSTLQSWGSPFTNSALQLGYTGFVVSRNDSQNQIQIGTNAYFNGTNWIYRNNSFASRYYQFDGSHIFSYATSGTAGNPITFVDALTITSAGNVGIGTSSPTQILDVFGPRVRMGDGGGFELNFNTTTFAAFQLNGTERMRITSGGNLLVNTTSDSGDRVTIKGGISVGQTGSSDTGGYIQGITSGNGLSSFLALGASFGAGGAGDVTLQNQVATKVIYVRNVSAGVYLSQGSTSWTANSDETIKDIIEPISNGLDKLKDLRTVIYKLKNDDTNQRKVGLIAQDVEKVLPEAITKNYQKDYNREILGLNYTDLIPVLVKAIQEMNTKLDEQNQTIQNLQEQINILAK